MEEIKYKFNIGDEVKLITGGLQCSGRGIGGSGIPSSSGYRITLIKERCSHEWGNWYFTDYYGNWVREDGLELVKSCEVPPKPADSVPTKDVVSSTEEYTPKIGDWVTITKSDQNWNDNMNIFIGKTVKIDNVKYDNYWGYIINFNGFAGWMWTSKSKHFRSATPEEIERANLIPKEIVSTPVLIDKIDTPKQEELLDFHIENHIAKIENGEDVKFQKWFISNNGYQTPVLVNPKKRKSKLVIII